MSEILVIRFGSLGDLCVLGWSLARLADAAGPARPQVTLVTKPVWAPLVRRFRGVDRVLVPEGDGGPGPLRRLAGDLRAQDFDRVVDAHAVLRSRLLLGLARRRCDRRLAKDTLARLAFMRLGRRSAVLRRTMRDRFDALFDLPPTPADQETPPPIAAPAGADARLRLGLAPGAQWDTKRWPDNKFAELLKKHLEAGGADARIFLGPREETWFSGSALRTVADAAPPGRVEVVRGRDLVAVADLLAECYRVVTNDSGLLHLAEAVGTPVTAFFGPTVREFGYFPQLPTSRVLETGLDCRPCSRNGKRACHRGDLACLDRIEVDAALAALKDPEVPA
jgi:heptosyltransferase-2